MRINPIPKNEPAFKGALNNKILLKSLEKISDHGATFAAGVSFLAAVGLRPLAISMTPKVDKENKKYASANSLASGLMKLAVAEAVALPVENAIKHIDKNPEKFLKPDTIKTLKSGAKTLVESKDYKFATQMLKQGTSFLTAIPKSYLTVALIPVIMDKILNRNKEADKETPLEIKPYKYDSVFAPVYDKTSFKGRPIEKLAGGIGKILDTNTVQKFASKHSVNDANIARNAAVATDILLTASSVFQTSKSKKIKEERKRPLIYNNILSTGASILFGCGIDKAVQKGGVKLVEKFKEANINNPKLAKYLEGINILRPTLVFALVYYGLFPVVTTFLADRADKIQNNKK